MTMMTLPALPKQTIRISHSLQHDRQLNHLTSAFVECVQASPKSYDFTFIMESAAAVSINTLCFPAGNRARRGTVTYFWGLPSDTTDFAERNILLLPHCIKKECETYRNKYCINMTVILDLLDLFTEVRFTRNSDFRSSIEFAHLVDLQLCPRLPVPTSYLNGPIVQDIVPSIIHHADKPITEIDALFLSKRDRATHTEKLPQSLMKAPLASNNNAPIHIHLDFGRCDDRGHLHPIDSILSGRYTIIAADPTDCAIDLRRLVDTFPNAKFARGPFEALEEYMRISKIVALAQDEDLGWESMQRISESEAMIHRANEQKGFIVEALR